MTEITEKGIKLTHEDERGQLITIPIYDGNIIEEVKEVNILTINPLEERGKHHHDVKEWFFIIKGHGTLIYHNTKILKTINISERKKDEQPTLIEIQPYDCHIIRNTCPDTIMYILSLLPKKFKEIMKEDCKDPIHDKIIGNLIFRNTLQ